MYTTICRSDGSQRPADLRQPCPSCGSKMYMFNLYLRPEEARGLKVAAMILITTILLVAIGLGWMYWALGSQIASMPHHELALTIILTATTA